MNGGMYKQLLKTVLEAAAFLAMVVVALLSVSAVALFVGVSQ